MGLLSELRRRNVFRMAVLYIAAAWLVAQVAGVLIDLKVLPEQIGPPVFILLAIGFPIALIFSWFYELTPEGISLEKKVEVAESITHITGRRMDFVVISLLCAAVILFAVDKWWVGPPSERSIAVLPFVNMSDDAANEYFSDGVSEELLDALAQIPGLRVISRTSAFYFKDKNVPLTEIAGQLKVAHILEGSVRRAGNRVRITAQLIDTSSDAHMWSHTYDRELNDIFLVQQEIAGAIADALELRLMKTSGDGEDPAIQGTTSTEAYDLYLRAREFRRKGYYSDDQEAANLLERALRLDSNFALAHAELALTFLYMTEGYGYRGRLSYEEVLRRATPHLERAAELDPNLYLVHLVRSHLAFNEQDLVSAIHHARKALDTNPSNANAMITLAWALESLGRYEETLDVYHRIVRTDPLNVSARGNLLNFLCQMGRVDEGRELARGILAQNRARGYRKLGEIAFFYDGKIAEGISWFLKAYAEKDKDTRINRFLVNALISLGEYDEARRIDDLFIVNVDLAEGHFDAAIRATQEKMQRNPQNPAAIHAAANALYLGGRIDEALPLYERMWDSGPEGRPIGGWWSTTRLAVARRHAGDETGAQAATQIVRADVSAWRKAIGESSDVARADALLAAFDGDTDGVIDALTAAIRVGYRDPLLFVDPTFAGSSHDERFVSIRKELDDLLSDEHDKFLQLVCFENPVPDAWRPLPETCEGVIR